MAERSHLTINLDYQRLFEGPCRTPVRAVTVCDNINLLISAIPHSSFIAHNMRVLCRYALTFDLRSSTRAVPWFEQFLRDG
ncbi:hypothetical protein SNOG_03465 [Parastagonospora nodorum SN15]|uniref:Uncharacterized protein n=1 Tax=Phaeosphaeria nodorum (strain SN15 / ATCC MYA-4574 / FGSC 10173) TaxID=321614 RepID=Q0UXP9_PHANO|nr:hypothetical protein SNOG_03465 [Parastagonospora nodorum SN15]EAT88670.1 hypothetical protein SNOG_03465 [Parastagonospora nodorum SN15]